MLRPFERRMAKPAAPELFPVTVKAPLATGVASWTLACRTTSLPIFMTSVFFALSIDR